MNANLHAWLILALGVSSPSAAAIASGSSTSVATSTVEADDDNRHHAANVGSPAITTTDDALWNKSHHLRHRHTTVHGSNVEQTHHHRRLKALEKVGNNGSPAENFPLGNW